MSNFRVCSNCVMDPTHSRIRFDANGVCDHCTGFETDVLPKWYSNNNGKAMFRKVV